MTRVDEQLDASLAAVLEAPGVLDVGLLDATGAVVAYHGSLLSPTAFVSFGRHLTTLFDTLRDNLEPMAEVVLTFDAFSLFLRSQDPLLLFVMVQRPLNIEAVRIAANTTLKRLRSLSPRDLEPHLQPQLHPPRVPTLPSPSAAGTLARASTQPGKPPASTGAPSAKPASAGGATAPRPAKKKNDIWG